MSEKVAGTSYILNFYRDIIILTHYVAVYMNVLAELEFKYSNFDLAKLDPEEKNLIVQNIQDVRYNANKCKIEYSSLRKKLKFEDFDHDRLVELSGKLNSPDSFVIDRHDAEAFAEAMNELLVNDVIQHVLETNQDLMQQLFGDGQKQIGSQAADTI